MVAGLVVAYFSEYASSHWLVGRALGIRFTGYGLHGTSHPHLYPPGARFLFSRLPLLSARVDPASLRAASPAARADRKSTRLNSSHANISYAVFCLKKKQPTTPLIVLDTLFLYTRWISPQSLSHTVPSDFSLVLSRCSAPSLPPDAKLPISLSLPIS